LYIILTYSFTAVVATARSKLFYILEAFLLLECTFLKLPIINRANFMSDSGHLCITLFKAIKPSCFIVDSLGPKRNHFRWVPHELSCPLEEKNVVMCRELVELSQKEETFAVPRAVTADESWLYLNDSRAHMWSVPDDQQPVHVDQAIASEKHIVTVFWSIKGPLVIESLGPGDTFSATSFCDVILAKLAQALYPGGAVPRRRKLSLNLDNASPPNSAGATEFIDAKCSSDYRTRHIRRM
jgi:hypothetical protein